MIRKYKKSRNQENHKNQGSDNFGTDMKQDWEIKEFEDCLEKVVYTNKIQRKDFLEVGDYPIISQEQDFINGYWDNSNDLFKVKKPIVIFGDHTQVLKYVDFDFVLGADGVKILQPINSIDPRFFYYFLQNINLGSLGYARHYRLLKEIEVTFPKSLPEQQRIVAILDEAFAAIAKAKANAEKNLKNAKELFESYLQGVFENKGEGWEEKTLAQISKTFGRGKSKHRPRSWNGLYGGKYPFIQTGDIRNCNHYITKYSQTYNDVGLAQSKLWKAGTICITIAANIAETGILTFDACFPDSVIGIEVNEKYADRDFVEYLLQSFKVRIQALGKGSAQANINMGTFENELFPFPTVAEQKSIVEKLNQLSAESNKLETIYLKKLEDLEELKKSVLQKAFSGGLNYDFKND